MPGKAIFVNALQFCATTTKALITSCPLDDKTDHEGAKIPENCGELR